MRPLSTALFAALLCGPLWSQATARQTPADLGTQSTPSPRRPVEGDGRAFEPIADPKAPEGQRIHLDGTSARTGRAQLDDVVPTSVEAAATVEGGRDVVREVRNHEPAYLGFAAGPYAPPSTERIDPRLLAHAKLVPLDERPQPTAYAFAIFSKRITEARVATLESLGARVLGFHPEYSLKLALPPQSIDAIAALDFVQWLGVPQDWQKISPILTKNLASAPANVEFEMHVSVFESDLNDLSTSVPMGEAERLDVGAPVVRFAPDHETLARRVTSNGWQQRALESSGVTVIEYVDQARAFRVRALPAAIETVAALDFVQYLEPVLPAGTAHDESIPMQSGDITRYYYNGGTTSTVIAGQIDTGLDYGHIDFYTSLWGWGWDWSGSSTGAWYDGCEHGSHVAGSLLGDGIGNPRYRGMAPGLGWGPCGRYYNVKVGNDSCTFTSSDHQGWINNMQTQIFDGSCYTPVPHVVSNSWRSFATSGSPFIGSEFDCRIFDTAVNSWGQMWVFCAGNEGGPSMIGLQPASKNVFAVGSVDDYPTSGYGDPGIVSNFSSRGPMGDTRWKPNVCAPGSWITSVDANSGTGYQGMAGTSMATPQVSGIAAQLMDAYSWLQYWPERTASLLMASAVTKDNVQLTLPSDSHLNNYGTGRVDAYKAMFGTSQLGWSNWGAYLPNNSYTYADFTIGAGCQRLVVCMHYSETPASAGASQALVNNFDLYVDQPPIDPNFNAGDFTAQQSTRNNTEIRIIDFPAAGTWRWKIWPTSTTSGVYYGLTTYVIYGDTTPSVAAYVSPSDYYIRPNDLVNVYTDVYNPSAVASAAYVDGSTTGGLSSYTASKYLGDGTYVSGITSLDNELGNILHDNWRSLITTLSWWQEGVWTVTSQVRGDNFATQTPSTNIVVDGTGPNAPPNLHSTSHTVFVANCNPIVDMAWNAASDNLSGVQGYSYQWDQTSNSIPDQWIDTYSLGTSNYLSPSDVGYYFHVAAIDNSDNVGFTSHLGPFFIAGPIGTYCTAKVNSQGCSPQVSWSGTPSMSVGPDDFHVTCAFQLNKKNGIMFWGYNPAGNPFQGGYLCVQQPVKRTPLANSGGSPTGTDCTGTFDFHFTQAYMAFKGLSPGQHLYAQFWSRDPVMPSGTSLSNALSFILCQ